MMIGGRREPCPYRALRSTRIAFRGLGQAKSSHTAFSELQTEVSSLVGITQPRTQ